MNTIHYGVEIYTDDGTPSHTALAVSSSTWGLVNGIFRFVSDRPKYDGSTVIPTYGPGEIDIFGNVLSGNNTNVFFENFLQLDGVTGNASNEIDISKGGDIATLGGFEFKITNSDSFWAAMLTAGPGGVPINFSGRKVRFIVFVNDVYYSRGVFTIQNNPYDEVDYKFSCGGQDANAIFLNVHKTIPPNIVTTTTFPASGIAGQVTTNVQIGSAVTPQSLIPQNATVQSTPLPVCIGDVPYAEMVNVEGIPQFENISILGNAGNGQAQAFVKNAPALALGNGDAAVNPAITVEPATNPSGNTNAGSYNVPNDIYVFNAGNGLYPPGTGFFPPAAGLGQVGSGCTVSIATISGDGNGVIVTLNIVNSGSGYSNGDFLLINGGYNGIMKVNGVNGSGGITSFYGTANKYWSGYGYVADSGGSVHTTKKMYGGLYLSGASSALSPYDWMYAMFLPYQDLKVAANSPSPFNLPTSFDAQKIPDHHFQGYYLFKQGDKKGIRIIDSYSTAIFYSQNLGCAVPSPTIPLASAPWQGRWLYSLCLQLAEAPEDFDPQTNALGSTITGATPLDYSQSWIVADTTAFWQICKSKIKQVVSNFPIQGFTPKLVNASVVPNGQINLRNWDDTTKQYEDVSNMVGKNIVTNGDSADPNEDTSFPYLQLNAATDVQENGISVLTPIILPSTAIKEVDCSLLVWDASQSEVIPKSVSVTGGIQKPDSFSIKQQNSGNASDFALLTDRNRSKGTQSNWQGFMNNGSGGGGIILNSATTAYGQDELAVVPISAIGGTGNPYGITVASDPTSWISGYTPFSTTQAQLYVYDGTAFTLCTIIDYYFASGAWIIQVDSTGGALSTTGSGKYFLMTRRGFMVTFQIDMTSLVDLQVDKAFFGIDYIAQMIEQLPTVGGGVSLTPYTIGMAFRLLDMFGRFVDLGKNAVIPGIGGQNVLNTPVGKLDVITDTLQAEIASGTVTPQMFACNYLPKDYYLGVASTNPGDNGESDRFSIASYDSSGANNSSGTGSGSDNAFSEIDLKTILTQIKNQCVQPILYVDIYFNALNTDSAMSQTDLSASILAWVAELSLFIKQIGFVAQKTVNTSNKALFAEVQGEMVNVTNQCSIGWDPVQYGLPVTSPAPAFKPGTKFLALNPGSGWTAGNYYSWNGTSWISSTPVTYDSVFFLAAGSLSGQYYTYNGTTWVAASYTNNVYTALRHLIEDYCTIAPSKPNYANLIDYGTVVSNRSSWFIGRQIKDQKSTIDYIQELCQQSFVSYFVSRVGKHSFQAWRESVSETIPGSGALVTHDESIIIRGSIKNFQKTDPSTLFNDFNLNFNNNPGLGRNDRSIIITHIDDQDPGATVPANIGTLYKGWAVAHNPGDGFPSILCIDNDGIPLWMKYCSFPGIPAIPKPWIITATKPILGGMNSDGTPIILNDGDVYYSVNGTTDGSPFASNQFYQWTAATNTWTTYPTFQAYQAAYSSAQNLWNACHASWLKTFTVQQTSGPMSNLSWFCDRSILSQASPISGVGSSASAFLLLSKMISWNTVQKYTVEYSVPITSDTVLLDLLYPVNFKDYFYTGDVAKLGWITKIECDVLNGVFNIGLMLQDGTV